MIDALLCGIAFATGMILVAVLILAGYVVWQLVMAPGRLRRWREERITEFQGAVEEFQRRKAAGMYEDDDFNDQGAA